MKKRFLVVASIVVFALVPLQFLEDDVIENPAQVLEAAPGIPQVSSISLDEIGEAQPGNTDEELNKTIEALQKKRKSGKFKPLECMTIAEKAEHYPELIGLNDWFEEISDIFLMPREYETMTTEQLLTMANNDDIHALMQLAMNERKVFWRQGQPIETVDKAFASSNKWLWQLVMKGHPFALNSIAENYEFYTHHLKDEAEIVQIKLKAEAYARLVYLIEPKLKVFDGSRFGKDDKLVFDAKELEAQVQMLYQRWKTDRLTLGQPIDVSVRYPDYYLKLWQAVPAPVNDEVIFCSSVN